MTASLVIKSPSQSPSLDQTGPAILVDEAGNRIPLMALVMPTILGETALAANKLVAGKVSQVTGLEQPPTLVNSDGNKVPVYALMGVDAATGKPKALVMPAAAVAASVSGKFASAEQTGTGSAQNVAHGLGVVPSAVLVSITDPGLETAGAADGALRAVIVEGSHTTTNVVVTVTAGAKFKVLAFV